MCPLPTTLFELLTSVVNGYEPHWRLGKGWTLEVGDELLQLWIDRGEIG
ncbi:MAG TPA: hypothetical protein V6C88_10335 [Chroococcidiopsis sp.]